METHLYRFGWNCIFVFSVIVNERKKTKGKMVSLLIFEFKYLYNYYKEQKKLPLFCNV